MTCQRCSFASAEYDWRDGLVDWRICSDCAAVLLAYLLDADVAEFVGPTEVEWIGL